MTKIVHLLGASTIALSVTFASHAAPAMLDTEVINVDVQDGKATVTFNRGAEDGVLPGATGYFTEAGKKKGPDSGFEIYKVTQRGAWARTKFSLDAVNRSQGDASRSASVASTHSCKLKGDKPSFGASKEVATGQKPPPGYAFATVTSATEYGDTKVSFVIDKGTDDGVLPNSQAYVLMPSLGTPMPYVVDLTWVSKNSAGGTVRVPKPESDKQMVRKIGFEVGTCKAK